MSLQTKYRFSNIDALIDLYLETNFQNKEYKLKQAAACTLKLLRNKDEIDLDWINDYFFNNTKWARNTKRIKLSQIQAFLEWLGGREKIDINHNHLLKYRVRPTNKGD